MNFLQFSRYIVIDNVDMVPEVIFLYEAPCFHILWPYHQNWTLSKHIFKKFASEDFCGALWIRM